MVGTLRWIRSRETIELLTPADAPIGVYDFDDWRGSLRFYSQRHLVVLHNQSEIRQFFERYPESFTLMLARDYRRFRSRGLSLRAHGGRRAIVGRSGKYIRKQIWDRIVVTSPAVVEAELRIDESAIGQDLADQ